MQLVAVALGKGATAGVACAKSLHGRDTSPQSPDPAPDAEALEPDTTGAAPGGDEPPDVTPRT